MAAVTSCTGAEAGRDGTGRSGPTASRSPPTSSAITCWRPGCTAITTIAPTPPSKAAHPSTVSTTCVGTTASGGREETRLRNRWHDEAERVGRQREFHHLGTVASKDPHVIAVLEQIDRPPVG